MIDFHFLFAVNYYFFDQNKLLTNYTITNYWQNQQSSSLFKNEKQREGHSYIVWGVREAVRVWQLDFFFFR